MGTDLVLMSQGVDQSAVASGVTGQPDLVNGSKKSLYDRFSWPAPPWKPPKPTPLCCPSLMTRCGASCG